MIALTVNNYVWSKLSADPVLNAKYAKYRTQLGANFKPFFPVYDNLAGDITWGSECYVLYDTMTTRPTREIYAERHEQVMYTLVGPIPDLFEFKDAIVNLFDNWENTSFNADGYRINDINVWQPDRTRGRDKVRQTYSTTLLLDVHYIPC
jgi:hypothetical protein